MLAYPTSRLEAGARTKRATNGARARWASTCMGCIAGLLLTVTEVQAQQPQEFWQALADAANVNHLYDHVDYLATTLRTRHYKTAEMQLANEYVKAEFEALGLDTFFDPFTTIDGYPQNNVIGIKYGVLDPSRIYVVGGHLDSRNRDPAAGEFDAAPGADDNGTGSAAVLEAARLLASLDTDYTIYFMTFATEELGFPEGSDHFAAGAELLGLDIQGFLNIDMIGWKDPKQGGLWIEGFTDGASSVWLMDLLRSNAEDFLGLAVRTEAPGGLSSDHENFHAHGYPAVISHEWRTQFHGCHHHVCDEVKHLDADQWRAITAANVITLAQLANVGGSLGTIDGTVTISGGGDPTGTTVRMSGTAYPEQVSDPVGDFGWEGVFPGNYTLVADKDECLFTGTDVVVSDGGTTVAAMTIVPEEQQVHGRKLRIKNKLPDDESRNKISFRSKDACIGLPVPDSTSDPRCGPGRGNGGTIMVSSALSLQSFSQTLPCENWSLLGEPASPKGYSYVDKELDEGPCSRVTLKEGRFVKAVCRGKGPTTDLDYDLEVGQPQMPVSVVVTTGAERKYCAEFGGKIKRDGSDGTNVSAKGSDPPIICP